LFFLITWFVITVCTMSGHSDVVDQITGRQNNPANRDALYKNGSPTLLAVVYHLILSVLTKPDYPLVEKINYYFTEYMTKNPKMDPEVVRNWKHLFPPSCRYCLSADSPDIENDPLTKAVFTITVALSAIMNRTCRVSTKTNFNQEPKYVRTYYPGDDVFSGKFIHSQSIKIILKIAADLDFPTYGGEKPFQQVLFELYRDEFSIGDISFSLKGPHSIKSVDKDGFIIGDFEGKPGIFRPPSQRFLSKVNASLVKIGFKKDDSRIPMSKTIAALIPKHVIPTLMALDRLELVPDLAREVAEGLGVKSK
jgi:hypothetical protein